MFIWDGVSTWPAGVPQGRRTFKVDAGVAPSGGAQFLITFISSLDRYSSTAMTLTSTDTLATLSVLATRGKYPCAYMVREKGMWSLSVTGPTGAHIIGSPFSVFVEDDVAHAGSSTSTGTGLVGGVAGEVFPITLQVNDAREPEEQRVVIASQILAARPEIHLVSCNTNGGSWTMTYGGVTVSVVKSSTTLQSVLNTLNTHPLLPNAFSSNGSLSAVFCLTSGALTYALSVANVGSVTSNTVGSNVAFSG